MRYNFDHTKGPIKIEWCVGAETNLSYNCLDRHVKAGHVSCARCSPPASPERHLRRVF